MTANDEYFPVPTISRDVNVRSAMTRGSGVAMVWVSSSAMLPACRRTAPDEVDDLDSIALPDYRGIEQGPPDHHQIVLDGDAPAVDGQAGKEGRNGHWAVELIRFAVEGDGHERRESAALPQRPQQSVPSRVRASQA